MPLDFQRARPLLQNGNLTRLFVEELGWEPCRQKLTLRAGESDYAFTAVAEKRGFTAWLCTSPDGRLPDHTTRLKLDRALTQTSFEHLIVFATSDQAHQSWMWVRRETGRPLSARTHEFNRTQPGDSLLQKLQTLYVSLEEEEKGELSTITMAGRARAAFDIERVTKAFYRDFDTHRKAFLQLIDGIGEVADREWYASVMLNRLMFVYFIQRKGFLDGDHDYLRNRLDRCQKEQGKDRFYTFYRYFLLRLFHEGFGKRRKDRAPDLEKLLGNIPYLNGGLFDVHELEQPDRYGKEIQIPDKAFERVFDCFDKYQWHLDERPLRKDDEINPDVLGYIFEKYINQKQMGAYYTKEDITEYISKNTVLPFIFDAARAKCKVAFENPNGPTVWDLLRENPDRYIYAAVRHGAGRKLPPEIAAGLDTKKPNLIERRKPWNKSAPGDYALPTEIWREVIARRQRHKEVRNKLAAGEVREVNDFITLNLDLRQFAQDIIQNCEGPDLLMALWQAITVLDPTGGSGAFIFAALNILEPLYEACLDRMEAFLAEWRQSAEALAKEEAHKPKQLHPNYHKKFTEVLARVDAHPNRRYFVLKSIILNNLYAVDIMEEAVGICKLRLFLKLASQVEPDVARDNLGIEPLPDIDFNIRAGNTLVGYATYDEVKRAVTSTLDFDNAMETMAVKAADLQQTFDKFRQLQTEGDGSVPAAHKLELQKRLKALEDELNRHLAGEYGVKVSDKAAYAQWVKTHQPFHWFIQFYGILNGGGFDVIIGNPPYIEYGKVKQEYAVKGYQTESCGNLYAFVVERALRLLNVKGCMSMIVPVSLIATPGYYALRDLVFNSGVCFVSSFNIHPCCLFEGANPRLCIPIIIRDKTNALFTTNYQKWYSQERDFLFQRLTYALIPTEIVNALIKRTIPKISSRLALDAFTKLQNRGPLAEFVSQQSRANGTIYYRRTFGAFVLFYDRPPKMYDEHNRPMLPTELKEIYFPKQHFDMMLAIYYSNSFYLYTYLMSDCRNMNKPEVEAFPINLIGLEKEAIERLRLLNSKLSQDLQKNSTFMDYAYTTGRRKFQAFYPRLSKFIIDEVDTVLAGHYGFTAEELDFILNYDIKYRMGRDTGEEENE